MGYADVAMGRDLGLGAGVRGVWIKRAWTGDAGWIAGAAGGGAAIVCHGE